MPVSHTAVAKSAATSGAQHAPEVLEALERFLQKAPSAISRYPENLREQLRAERRLEMLRIATILAPAANVSEGNNLLFKALGDACDKVPSLKGLNTSRWQQVYFLLAHLRGPQTDYETHLKAQLKKTVDEARPAAVKGVLERTLDLINFNCFVKLSRDQERALWLRPEAADNLLEIVNGQRDLQGLPALESIWGGVPDNVPAVPQSTRIEPITETDTIAGGGISVPSQPQAAAVPSLAQAVMPQIDRNAAQIAIQVGGGLLFAQAIEGQEIVISNNPDGVSVTLRKVK